MRTRRSLALCALFALALAALGLWAGWLRTGFSSAELAELEHGWSELRTWARFAADEPADPCELERVARRWDAAQSESERLGLLAGFEEALISGDWSVPTDGGAMLPLLEIARVALDAPDVDATRVARVLGLAREMQRRGHLLTFFVGTSLATDTLERCRAEPSLVPSDLDLPPPRPSELFEALCRDHVIAGETWAHEPGGLPPGGGALPALSGGDEVVARALRSALVHDARRLHPLRDTPERFGELAPPAVPGLFLRLRAACLARPADLRALLAPLIAVDMAAHGRRWTEFVAEWNAVLRG